MKICMFTNTFLPHVGGVARSVSILSRDLERMGHEILVVAPHFPGEEPQTEQNTVLRVPAIQNFNGSDFSVRIPLPFALSEEIDLFRPEVIHSHHPFLLGDTALRAARQRNLPLIFTHHTLYEEYTHYVPFDSQTMKRFVINLSTQYANLCNRVIAPSRSIAQLIRSRGVRTQVEEIPTGVDLDFFAKGDGARFRKELGIPADWAVAGHLGRLAPEKNLTYLARAVGGFLQHKETAAFVVVGEGPSRQEMSRIFSELNVADRVHFVGKQTGDRLRDAYRAMDLFVFTSQSETQGLVLMEAMASGVPVIALDASGSREVVQDGSNGLLLPQDAPESAFTSALLETARDPSILRTWSQQALQAAQQFSRQHCAERILSLYESASRLEPAWKKPPDELVSWDTLLRALKAEWDLLSKNTSAVFSAVRQERKH